ncbi:hypothetical protein QJS04_geneDACA021739 [Acorus gramineus]|uniref:EF-hand domain-containing protein n=1 Tax=Acorus gramineus TaxID=55184 RepID=A0AAV9AHI5_ACOGR|nr:hypothetical protein QJS04_geneDACA021739 [Acorus gramineus]
MTEKQFQNWLSDIDMNDDGKISKREFRKALHVLGLHFTRLKAGCAMAWADLDHNHYIEGKEEVDKLIDYAKKLGLVRDS